MTRVLKSCFLAAAPLPLSFAVLTRHRDCLLAKGFFTQGVSLLTNGQTTTDASSQFLRQHGFDIVKESPAQENWAFWGATLIIAFRPDVNGYVSVDLVNHPWPIRWAIPNRIR